MGAFLPAAALIAAYVFGICRKAPAGWEVNRPDRSLLPCGPPMARSLPAPVKMGWSLYGGRRVATSCDSSRMQGLSAPPPGAPTVISGGAGALTEEKGCCAPGKWGTGDP